MDSGTFRSALSTLWARDAPPGQRIVLGWRSPSRTACGASIHPSAPRRVGMTIVATSSRRANASKVRSNTGRPASSSRSLFVVPPNRVELPAAGRMTARVIVCSSWRNRRQGATTHRPSSLRRRRMRLGAVAGRAASWRRGGAVAQPAEDHLAGAGLQHAGHRELDLFVDVLPALLDDHHRAVFEVSNALA